MNSLQKEFPQLETQMNGQRLVYLDSAATSLKPRAVIEKMRHHLASGVANVHRGAHYLSDVATDEFELVRGQIGRFLNAHSASEIIFTPGTTGSLNLLASSLGRHVLAPGDEILLTQMEHHSNIVPWQMIAQQMKARVRFVPMEPDGSLSRESFHQLLSPRIKIVSMVHLSNALGTWNNLKEFAAAAKKVGAYFVVDAAQSVTARPVDVQDLDCDFLAFSGHKIFGPTGVGVLYGREKILNALPPYMGGGSMINQVTEEQTTYLEAPHRFEAGTPPIAEVLALGEAIRFFSALDRKELMRHDQALIKAATQELKALGGVEVYGEAQERSHVVSFNLAGAHPADVGAMLNEQAIAVRTGHHCCQPLMTKLGIPGTVRASFSIYSTENDVARLIAGVKKVKGFLQ